jgi:hypothetical protein
MNRSSSRSCVMLLAAACIAVASQPAQAKEIDRGKLAANSDKLKGLCGNHDAEVWVTPDGNNYGCGFKGGGGILCDKDGGCVETDGNLEEGQERSAPWGWAGLLGLVGLLGLRRHNPRDADPVR